MPEEESHQDAKNKQEYPKKNDDEYDFDFVRRRRILLHGCTPSYDYISPQVLSIIDVYHLCKTELAILTKCNVTIYAFRRLDIGLAEKRGLCFLNRCERGGVGRSISASHHLCEEACVIITQASSF